ncbi:MAG TPA: MBL fold metallo-hydrolase [Acidimicrobiales bacterium]|nr:MBL fold metallo-hydrolase [Acidimicrobiales bacterium]
MCFRLEGSPILFSGDTLFPGVPGIPRSRVATSPPSSGPLTDGCLLPFPPKQSSCPGMARTRPSVPSSRSSMSGRTGAGDGRFPTGRRSPV